MLHLVRLPRYCLSLSCFFVNYWLVKLIFCFSFETEKKKCGVCSKNKFFVFLHQQCAILLVNNNWFAIGWDGLGHSGMLTDSILKSHNRDMYGFILKFRCNPHMTHWNMHFITGDKQWWNSKMNFWFFCFTSFSSCVKTCQLWIYEQTNERTNTFDWLIDMKAQCMCLRDKKVNFRQRSILKCVWRLLYARMIIWFYAWKHPHSRDAN